MDKNIYIQTAAKISQKTARMPDVLWKRLITKLIQEDRTFQAFVNDAALDFVDEPKYSDAAASDLMWKASKRAAEQFEPAEEDGTDGHLPPGSTPA